MPRKKHKYGSLLRKIEKARKELAKEARDLVAGYNPLIASDLPSLGEGEKEERVRLNQSVALMCEDLLRLSFFVETAPQSNDAERSYYKHIQEMTNRWSIPNAVKEVQALGNAVISKLNPKDFHEAINWGDLKVYEVTLKVDEDGNIRYVLHIDEASPDCPEFATRIKLEMQALGYNVGVTTEW